VTADQLAKSLADTAAAGAVAKTTPADTPGKGSPAAPSPFQFITLPDFEEQMAIKDVNFAAKGKYELKFADGWQLRSVGGAWDATEVAVRALQVLGDAVKAAASVRAEQLNKLPTTVKSQKDITAGGTRLQVLVVRVEAVYINPGIYKLLKSSEQQAPTPAEAATGTDCALISELGLPLVTDVQTYLLQP
jgi:hypothetical protein